MRDYTVDVDKIFRSFLVLERLTSFTPRLVTEVKRDRCIRRKAACHVTCHLIFL